MRETQAVPLLIPEFCCKSAHLRRVHNINHKLFPSTSITHFGQLSLTRCPLSSSNRMTGSATRTCFLDRCRSCRSYQLSQFNVFDASTYFPAYLLSDIKQKRSESHPIHKNIHAFTIWVIRIAGWFQHRSPQLDLMPVI